MNREKTTKYDSDFCGNLPIHMINVIQPYGAMIVIDKNTDEIIQVSENCADLLGAPVDEILHTKLSGIIETSLLLRDKPGLPQVFAISKKKYLGIYHDYPGYAIIEINLHSEKKDAAATYIEVYQELRETMTALESAGSLKNTLDIAARELKRASGFDKVMIYRFDENWNGHVLAEEKEPEMESYLGFTFPASDIPKQARDLYLKNAYRFIPDREYAPVKMFPVINPLTNTFIDMSDCNVRGVSTVHLEYLKNMQVTASMSTRIIRDGKLWGLIACHHQTAMQMNYKVCTIFELLSGIISAKTATLEKQESHVHNSQLSGIYTSLVEETYRSSSLVNTLLDQKVNILQLFSANGAVISYDGNISKKGDVPESADIEDLILWLNTKSKESVFYTNSLSNEYDYATEFKEVASGMMAIPVDVSKDEYILLFRPEVVQVINWGGDPDTRISFESDMKTYHPRFSFKVWQEKVNGISQPWQEAEVEMAENLKDFVKAFLNGKDYTYKN